MLTNPENMISQKKSLVLKFEESHFEPAINLLIAPLLGNLDQADFHSHNIFDNDEDGKNTHSSENLDNTYEFHKNTHQVPHDETKTMKTIIKKIINMMCLLNLFCVDKEYQETPEHNVR